MNAPSIVFLGIQLTEPFTLLTDLLVAVFCFAFAYHLYREKLEKSPQTYWAIFFLFIGLASLIGGVAHGFILYVGMQTHYSAWLISSLGIFAAQMATLPLINNKQTLVYLRFLVCIELIVSLGCVLYFRDFDIVRINSAFGLLVVVLPILFFHYQENRDRGSALLIIGILSNLFPAIIHAFHLSYSIWFTANDLSHVVMVLCFYLMFKGASQIAFVVPSEKLAEVVVRA
jgi:hypothetical protein